MYMLKLLSDLETPVSTFMKLAQHEEHSFLLESTEHGSNLGRYSFIGVGAKDFLTLESDGELVSANGKVEYARTPLSALPRWLEPHSFTLKSEELPPFVGGAVGYVGYDYIRYLEDVPAKVSIFPTFHFIVPAHLVIFDHLKSQIHVISEEPEEIAKKMRERLRVDITNTSVVTEPESNFKKVDFCEAVKKVKRYIVDGDAFQVVISQAFHFKTTLSPFSIYRALRVVNPSPYMFYLKSGEITVLGSSPETMVKLQDGAVTLKPIAGTRPRGETPEEDVRLEKELFNDEKERAEHVMLVDLGRNDLGRVCEYGTVKVNKQMVVEKYSHVMHLVSQVSGKVREDKTAVDVFESTFPAGTVTGAPKVRAMEIIEESEPTPRGPYAGAVGYFSFPNEKGRINTDSAIAIRSFFFKGDEGWLQAGAGIVCDSIPEREYQETLNKLYALFKSLEIAVKIQGGIP